MKTLKTKLIIMAFLLIMLAIGDVMMLKVIIVTIFAACVVAPVFLIAYLFYAFITFFKANGGKF